MPLWRRHNHLVARHRGLEHMVERRRSTSGATSLTSGGPAANPYFRPEASQRVINLHIDFHFRARHYGRLAQINERDAVVVAKLGVEQRVNPPTCEGCDCLRMASALSKQYPKVRPRLAVLSVHLDGDRQLAQRTCAVITCQPGECKVGVQRTVPQQGEAT